MKMSDHQIAVAKVSPPVVVTLLQEATAGLPTFILWATAIYTVLQVYILVRDKLIKRKKDCE